MRNCMFSFRHIHVIYLYIYGFRMVCDRSLNMTAAVGETTPLGKTQSDTHWEKKLLQAEAYKAEGNELYKNKDYMKAVGKYHRALLYLRAITSNEQAPLAGFMQKEEPISAEARKRITQVMVDCYNNLAACLLQSAEPSYTRVLDCCEKATELSPTNVKALFRKGVALHHLRKSEEALAVLKKASSLPGGTKDANINKYIRLCNDEITQQEQKLRNQCKAMFAESRQSASST